MTVYAHTTYDVDVLNTVPVTIRLTKPLAYWRALKERIYADGVTKDLHSAIAEAIADIEAALVKCGAGRDEDDDA